jgi:MFS family permease
MLSNRTSFWTAAAVAALALWASGAPSMVYPVYTAEWGLTPSTITAIFAVYPISLVVILVVFGSLSDFIGRRPTLIIGVSFIAGGILLFAIAPNVGWLFAGRVLQGVGVGFAMSPASAAMVEFNSSGKSSRASSINTAATATGLALATVVGGALVQYAPWPSHLTYWVLLVIALGVLGGVFMMPRGVAGSQSESRWRPQRVGVQRSLVRVFLVSSLAIAAGFSMGALLLSLGSQIAKDLIKTDNAFVAGSVLAIQAIAIGVVAIAGRRIEPRTSVIIGGIATAAGMGVLVLAARQESLPVFVVASVIAGAGYGLLFLGGLGLTNRHAPTHHRASTLSAVYLVAYFTQGVVAVAIGITATAVGLEPGLDIWAPIIAGICLLATVLAIAIGRPRAVATA